MVFFIFKILRNSSNAIDSNIPKDVDLSATGSGQAGYVITTYLPNGYQGNNEFDRVDSDYVLQYFKDIRCYFRGNEKGIWIETQTLPMDKCLELKSTLGSWFYKIE
ncbi:glycoside hydrolase, family 25 [Clostridium saccharoperbutylacetonicum N1-4(HMT)]|uniref:Glycoside hydrolase, family 25 n=1 Tax=Clostridium saccharoperbutylacetonicum N1-4(HMT) TaxID=931276 RepID=M1MH44_9CLOT|nr:glycoside hydrolase, family 25 [Clostridium saccharoperbutylacetonicum N1-4(HMT)]